MTRHPKPPGLWHVTKRGQLRRCYCDTPGTEEFRRGGESIRYMDYICGMTEERAREVAIAMFRGRSK